MSNATDEDRPDAVDRLRSRLGLAAWVEGEPARLRAEEGRIRVEMQGAEPGTSATYMRPSALIEAMASDDVRPMAEEPFAAWIAERAGAEVAA